MNNTFTYYYYPDLFNEEPNIEFAYDIKSSTDIMSTDGDYDKLECEWLVEEMAKDYFDRRDGWEIANNWQGETRDFALWDCDKNFVGIFEVLLEYEPTFSAWIKK